MSKLTKNQKGFSIVEALVIVVIIFIVGIVGVIVYAQHSVKSKLHSQQNTALASAQPQINTFNQTSIINSQPNINATVTKEGDGIDTTGYVQAYKKYTVNMNAGSAEDNVVTTLTKQGYVESTNTSNDTYTSNRCGVSANLTFTKNSTIINVDLATELDTGTQSCSYGNPITDATFRTGTVYQIYAQLKLSQG